MKQIPTETREIRLRSRTDKDLCTPASPPSTYQGYRWPARQVSYSWCNTCEAWVQTDNRATRFLPHGTHSPIQTIEVGGGWVPDDY